MKNTTRTFKQKIVDFVTGKKAPEVKVYNSDRPTLVVPEKKKKTRRHTAAGVRGQTTATFSGTLRGAGKYFREHLNSQGRWVESYTARRKRMLKA